jgi:hypothetical protein
MSKAVEVFEKKWQPGDIKPGHAKLRWVVCPRPGPHSKGEDGGRWLFGDHRLAAADYVRDCNLHAARARGNLRIRESVSLSSFTGAVYHLGEIIPDEPDKRYVTCPICDDRHKESVASRKELRRRRGICPKCLPWALLWLKAEDYRLGKRRDEAYAKIRRICGVLNEDCDPPPRGQLLSSMPFLRFVKFYIEEFPRAAPQSNTSKSCHVRFLAFFFEPKSIGEIDRASVEAFTRAMLNDNSRWKRF